MERERAFLLVVIGIFAVLGAALLQPFLQYVLAAILLAYVLIPLQRRLEPRLGPRIAALVLLVLAFVAILIPVGILARTIVREAPMAIEAVQRGLRALPEVVTIFGTEIPIRETLLPGDVDGTAIAQELLSVIGSLSDAGLGVIVLLFTLYYLLVAGSDLRQWLYSVLPLSRRVQDDLYAQLNRLMWASVVGNVVVALIQGVFTGLGLWAVGIPSVAFWTVVATLLALLPLVGAPIVWVPASAFLFLTGEPIRAALLFVYGTVVVSISDDYVRPMIGGHEAGLNPGLFVLGIFGGVAVFGFMGIFFGPIVLGALKALVEVYAREYTTGT